MAVLAVSVPPLGVIGWISPAHVVSSLFPGLRWLGLALGIAALGWAAAATWSTSSVLTGLILGIASVTARTVATMPAPPAGWIAVNTRLDGSPERDFADM